MGSDRDLFSATSGADQAELKAHAALYAAREASAASAEAAVPALVTARPRPVPQRGAAVARQMREKLVTEREQLVATSRRARTGADGTVPTASVLRFSLADLPRLTAPGRKNRKVAVEDPNANQTGDGQR